MELTQELIRKHFSYDPTNGVLMRSDLKKAVPTYTPYVSFKGKLHSTARIIYQYMVHGEPPKLILRLDRDPANNKWSNFTTTVQGSMNSATGEPHVYSSKQKRPVELSVNEMQNIFKLDIERHTVTKAHPKTKVKREVVVKTYKLWFLLSPTPTLCMKPTLKFKWQGITYIRTRAHVIMRMQYIDSSQKGYSMVTERSLASRAKRHETQRIKALRKNDAEPV